MSEGLPNVTPTKYVGFYSFKGGVGRTLALVGTALEFVRQGKRVLLVDTDLEAPGLSLMPDFKKVLNEHPGYRGFMEVVTDSLRGQTTPFEPTTIPLSALPVATRLSTGLLCFVPSGSLETDDGKDYGSLLDSFQSFNLNKRDGIGDIFRQVFQRILAPDRSPFDVVLIDLRTGLSLLSIDLVDSICDVVVVVSSLNEQNIAGTANFCATLRARAADGHQAPEMLLVISPVPSTDPERQQRKRDEFIARVGIPNAEIHYNSSIFFSDELAPLRQLPFLPQEHAKLAHAIRDHIGLSAKQHLRNLEDAIRLNQIDAAESEALEVLLAMSEEQFGLLPTELRGSDIAASHAYAYLRATLRLMDATPAQVFELAILSVQKLRWATVLPICERFVHALMPLVECTGGAKFDFSTRQRARLEIDYAIALLFAARAVDDKTTKTLNVHLARDYLLKPPPPDAKPTDHVRRAIGLAYLADVEKNLDNIERADDLLRLAKQDVPNIAAWEATVLSHFARIAAGPQKQALWTRTIDAAKRNEGDDPAGSWYVRACAHAQCGEIEEGYYALRRAMTANPELVFARASFDPDLGPLHGAQERWLDALGGLSDVTNPSLLA